jgi:stage V sporulation protein B
VIPRYGTDTIESNSPIAMSEPVQVISLPARIQHTWSLARSSDFARKVVETYLTRVAIMGLALVTTVVVSRLLGPRGRGFYAVALATGTLGVQFGNLGLHTSNVYFGARDPQSLPKLTGNSLALSFGFGGAVAIALGAILTLRPNLIDLHGITLWLALLWIPFGLAYLLLQNLMMGAHDVRGYNLVELANRLLTLLIVSSFFAVRWVTVPSMFGASVLALIVAFFWTSARLRRRFHESICTSWTTLRNSVNYAAKAYLAGFFCFLVLRADLFMVQHMLGPEQAGYYSIASTMADYVSMAAAVVALVLFPKLSALTDVAAKLHFMRRAAWATAAALTPLLVISSLLARPVVRLLFGPAFLPASWAFVLLAPGMLFLSIHSVTVQFLNSIGYPKIVVIIWGLCSLLNIAVNLWAIPRFGISGASVVSSVCYFLAFFFVLQVIRHTARRLVITTPGVIA